MKKMLFSGLITLAAVVLGLGAAAQSRYKKAATTTKPATTTAKPATAPAKTGTSKYLNAGASNNASEDTTIKNQTTPVKGTSKYLPGNNKPAETTTTTNNAAGAVTISYDTTIEGGFDTKPEISLRNNYAVDRSQARDRKPLPYEDIREDDQLWSAFVWREIDGRQKINQSFMYPGKDDNGDQRFFSILLSAIINDSVVAFSDRDDRFQVPLTKAQVMALTTGSYDTVDVPDPVSGAVERVITKKPRFSPDSVYTFRIKEQVVFDRESSRLYTRIIGIAPIAKIVVAGKSLPKLLFWVNYPEMRPTLTKFEVYNPKNFAARMTWEELFESRFFDSYIIKSSLNNPGDKSLSAMIKDPLFRLLEGENIKQKIFNYEQDLWAY